MAYFSLYWHNSLDCRTQRYSTNSRLIDIFFNIGLPHHGGHGPEKPHHGGHGPAPPPPTTHISNPPLVSSQHPMSNLSTSTTITATGRDPVSGGRESNPMRSEQQQQQPSQSLVSNGGLNGHTNIQGTQLFGDTEPENEKWWW